MGKIIVKNIGRMGFRAKLGLTLLFTVLISTFIYQGWYGPGKTEAAISQLQAWTNVYHSATAMNPATASFSVAAGRNRMLVVAVSSTLTGGSTQTTGTVSYGGTTMTLALGDAATSARQHTYLYYLPLGTATASDASKTLSVTITGGTSLINDIYYTVFTGVDQSSTPTNSRNYNSGSNLVSSAQFATALTVNANDQAVIVYNLNNTNSTTAPGYTLSTGWNLGATQTWTSNNGERSVTARYTIPSSSTTNSGSITITGVTSRVSMTGTSLKAATTTLGNGVAGTTANVAPGASGQKLDGFSLATGTANTTDSITGLAVTTTNQAAIASMQIWNEAGTTQYFTTVTNPGSDTWNFSGGIPIPVTNTAANYKILVTYDTRAGGAPTGNTATTAKVTSLTCSNITSGSDTADTTLTLLNTHNASVWGTNTAGNAQVTLNWAYGTVGQSVIIVRYTANTDTTKPTDGTTYSVGTSFGSGGTIRYNGAASTFTDTVGVTNGTTYYYKIFEYDTYTNYYNASDVWTTRLTPVSPDAVPPTVTAGFAATTPVNTLSIPITSFGATDNLGGSGVAGYLITTSSTQPSAGAAGWTTTPPTSYAVASSGTYTLYPWAKDGGGNVSAVYGTPVTVVVDTTAPTVSTFTVTSPSTSRTIPVTGFTASDGTGSGVAGYMITTSSTPPAAGAGGWSVTAPSTYVVTADGTYTLYPWVKDTAGNVSAVFGFPRTALVDTGPPTGLTLVSPADEATGVPTNVTLQCSTAADSGSGGVMYWFQISDGAGYSQNSGWIATTSFVPTGLQQGVNYVWSAKAKDNLGNETALTTPRSFTTTAPCVRNDPTLTLLTASGGIASTISSDGGSSVYNLKIINNDFGDCGATTFNLSVSDTDLLSVFEPPLLGVPSVNLNPGAQATTTVTVTGTPGEVSGVSKTRVTSAADASHGAVTTGDVQTTLNVVGCKQNTPLLIVGPASGYLNRNGAMVYTITVKNTDTGTGCAATDFSLSIGSESNNTDFSASQFSTTMLRLNSGELGSATLTVTAKSTAVRDAVNLTTVHVAATGHASPADVTVKTTVNNPMLHNSDNTGSKKWSGNGGWGIPSGRYGEFSCETCHVGGGGDTSNVKRINEKIYAPAGSGFTFPGEGQPVAYRRYVGNKPSDPVLGWDGTATPRATSTKVCEVCHTYDASGANGTKAHPYQTTATLGNHFNTDGKNCTKCHKHSRGFGASNMLCNSCHGDSSASTIDASNRYVVAPPTSSSGATGAITGVGQVSNDPKVGAHQTHLRYLNGFSNYSTVDYRCQVCHGPLPTDFSHANGSSPMLFQGLATRNAQTPTFSNANLTCSNTYCHNPAGTGGTLRATNVGSKVFPSWTSARYVNDGTKSLVNCSVCHKVPGVTGFEPASTHSNMDIVTTDCSSCHGHNGDASGTIAGRRHMDGYMFGAGNCDSCHGYQVGSWADKPARAIEGKGAHEKHIAYLVSRNNVTLSPTTDAFGTGSAWTGVCGVCHNGATHNMGEAIGGTGRTISIIPARQIGSLAPVYNGIVGQSSSVQPKTCSNVDCHYKETPVWSSY